MLDWASAPRLPTTIVSTARAATAGCHCGARAGSACTNTRSRAPKAAVFTPAAIRPVTVVGAPSYTSGAHMWKGTLATLKPKPTRSRPAPTSAMAPLPPVAARTAGAMTESKVLPLTP